MTPAEVAALLAYAAAIDPRNRRKDDRDRALQVTAWHAQLERADLADARAAVDAHYAQPGAEPPVPGDIRTLCVARANERADRQALAAISGPELVPMPDAVREQMRAIRDSWSAPLATNRPSGDRRQHARPPDRRAQTDADRRRAGQAITICHTCAGDIPAPPGWDPRDPQSPALHCDDCRQPAAQDTP